jgi:DNA-binding SARP family transcriptional activator
MLGSFQVSRADAPLTGFESNKVRALLAYLAVEVDRPHQRRKLAALLWPEFRESTALSNLRYALSNLRQVIGDRTATPAYLEIDPQEIRFISLSSSMIDVHIFERCCILSQQNPLDFQNTHKAADLFKGNFLDGFSIPDSSAFEEWLILKREHFDRLAVQVFHRLASDYELSGEHQQAISICERQLEIDPWREETHRQLMRCLYLSGQRNAALAQYETFRKDLADELSVEPEKETRELYRQIYEEKISAAPILPSFLRHSAPSHEARSRFVSRQVPLNRLQQALKQAMSGQGKLMLVTGGPGQGKTALVQEFMRLALQEYPILAAAWGNSRAYFGSGDPYLPFREILEILTGQVEHLWEAGSITQEHALRMWRLAAYSARALVQEGPALIGTFIDGQTLLKQASLVSKNDAAWLSNLQSLVERQSSKPPTPQADLFQQYGRVLAALSHRVPLLLFVDDLQWADQSSLALLFHLSRELNGARILIIGALRPVEEMPLSNTEHQTLATMVNELRLLHGDILINLDELEERRFIDAYLDLEPNRLDETFRQDLFHFTHGHPLFTVEMLYGMQQQRDLVKNPQGEWVVSPALSWDKLPAKVEAVIAERLSRLPQSLLALLQIASIEGERFTAEVAAKVRGADEQQVLMQLSSELDRQYMLVQADSTRRVNGIRISRYRFRHILFQRYLYSQLNLVERAQLHERVGRTMEDYYSSMLDEIAIQLAFHFEAASSPLKAIQYLHLAGQYATHLSSFEDAITHLSKALALLELQPGSNNKDLLELELLQSINAPLMLARGYASPELGIVCNRMVELLNHLPINPNMVIMIHQIGSYYIMRAEYSKWRTLIPLVRQITESSGDEFNHHYSDFGTGFSVLWLGELITALPLFEQMINFYDQSKHGQIHKIIGSDPAIVSLCWGSWTLWLLGYPQRAIAYSQQAVDLGFALNDPACQATSQVLAIILRVLMKDTTGVTDLIKSCSSVLALHPMPLHSSDLEFILGYYMVLSGEVELGLSTMIKGSEAYREIGTRNALSMHLTLLADAHLRNAQGGEAAIFIKQAEEFIEETGEKFFQAETLRVKGEMRLIQSPANVDEAESLFCQALQVAHAQEAKTLELRAAMSLARLRQSQGRVAEARQTLEDVYNWFTEGFNTPDLKEARMLLDNLST